MHGGMSDESTLPSSERPEESFELPLPEEMTFCSCGKSKNCPTIRRVPPEGSVEIFDADRGLERGSGLVLDREDALLLLSWLQTHVS